MRKALSILLMGAAAAGCGVGANKRLLTRPPSYSHALGWMQYGHPVDVEALVAEYPHLKGKVVTAPEYLEEVLAEMNRRKAEDRPLYDYKIVPGSTIDIEVVGEPELSVRSLFVPPDGYDYLPHLGRVQLSGKTRDELVNELVEKYRTILKQPQVLVHLRSGGRFTFPGADGAFLDPSGGVVPGQGYITVLGGAQGTGGRQVGLFGQETVFSVLGGAFLSQSAEWRAIRIIRRDDQDPFHRGRVIFVDAWEFVANADVRQDIPLRPGDFIFIPTKYTLGEHFDKDLNLLLEYAGKALSIDSLVRQLDATFFD